MKVEINGADIEATVNTIEASIDGQAILYRFRGRSWVVGESAELHQVVLCAIALMEFAAQQESAA